MVFVGTFTAGGTKVAVDDGKLRIVKEGGVKKFVSEVEQVTFSGNTARMNNLDVIFITERCVFTLTDEGVELTEIAPGVDLEKDILAYMDFKPIVKNPKTMDERIFRLPPMDLKKDLLSKPMSERMTYDPATNIFYVNFEGLHIRSMEDIEEIRSPGGSHPGPAGTEGGRDRQLRQFFHPAGTGRCLCRCGEKHRFDLLRERHTVHDQRLPADETGRRAEGAGVCPHVYESRGEARKGLKPGK